MTRFSSRWIVAAFCASVLVIGVILVFRGRGVVEQLLGAVSAVVGWVHLHPMLGVLGYVVFATMGKMTPFPSALLVMLTGGFLFGTVTGGLLAATGATLGAVLVYLTGRRLFAEAVARRFGRRIGEFGRTIDANAFSTLLAMRLLPGLPAWLVNLLPVPFAIPVGTIMLATFLGILPICMIAASAGHGLAVLGAGAEALSPRLLLRAPVLLPLGGLAVLAILPMIVRSRLHARRLRRVPPEPLADDEPNPSL